MPTPTIEHSSTHSRATGGYSIAKLVFTVLLLPAPFELITAFTKKEEYDYRRLIIVGGVVAILALVAFVWQRRYTRVQAAIGAYLIVIGSVLTALGVTLTFHPDLLVRSTIWSPTVATTVSAMTPAAGVLLVTAGIYLFLEQLRRSREEADEPGPRTIMNPKPFRIGDHHGSLWRSEHFHEYPAGEGLVELCKPYLSPVDLQFLAFYTFKDECLFYLDLLDDESMRRFNIRDTPQRRGLYEQAGRHARGVARRLERRFRSLDSGAMVRFVIDVEKGALFWYRLRDLGYLLGVTLDQTEVDATDR